MAVDLFFYRKGNTFFHKLSPHIKLWLMFAFCVFVFLPDEWFFCDVICDRIYFAIYLIEKMMTEKFGIAINEIAIGKFNVEYLLESLAIEQIPLSKFAISFVICCIAFFLSGSDFKTLKILRYAFFLGVLVAFGNGLRFAIVYTLKFSYTSFLSQIVFMTTSSLQMKDALEEGQSFVAKLIPSIKKANPALLVFLAISFIPQIFQTWNQVKLAAKARSGNRKSNRNFLRSSLVQFQALFSCMLYQAEIKRKALLNRS